MSGANSSPEQDVEMHVCATRDCDECGREVSTVQEKGRDDTTGEITKALALLDLNSKDAATRSDEEMDIDNEEASGAFNEAGEAMEDVEDGSPGDKGRDRGDSDEESNEEEKMEM